jgi:hypothetical protein
MEDVEMTPDEQIRNDAIAEGMGCEYMRIVRDIDSLIERAERAGSYAKGQRFILRKLKEIIAWRANESR